MISELSYPEEKVDDQIKCSQNNFDGAKDSKLNSWTECICIPSSNFTLQINFVFIISQSYLFYEKKITQYL